MLPILCPKDGYLNCVICSVNIPVVILDKSLGYEFFIWFTMKTLVPIDTAFLVH